MSQVSLRCEECGKRLTILAATPLGSTKKDFLSVCSGCVFPRHGYSFKDRTVWSSPNDSKCLRLGVSVLKISNLPIPEVAFNKNVKISQFFATRPCALIFTMNAHFTQLQGFNFFFMHSKVRVKWTEVV